MNLQSLRKAMYNKIRLDSEANPQEPFSVSRDATPIVGHSIRYLLGLPENVSDVAFAERTMPSRSGEIPTRPCIILTRINMRPDSSSHRHQSYLMTFHIFGKDATMKSNDDIEERLMVLFENRPLTIGGETIIGERMSGNDLSDFTPDVYHTTISFVYVTEEEFSEKNY